MFFATAQSEKYVSCSEYSGAWIIRPKSTQKFCANYTEYTNYPYIKVSGVYEEAYDCVNNDCAN